MARRVSMILFTVLLACAGVLPPGGAQGVVNPSTGHTYFITSGPTDVFTARAEAAALGGYPATVNDAAENQFIVQMFTPIMAALGSPWLVPGLSDEITEGVWLWDNGAPVNYFNWATGEPNNGCGPEDYIYIELGQNHPEYGHWTDINVTTTPPCVYAHYGLIEVDCLGGSGEDFIMTTQVNGVGGPSCGPKTAMWGDLLTVTMMSPMGGFAGSPAVLVGQIFQTGGPAPVGIPNQNVHIDVSSMVVLYQGFSPIGIMPLGPTGTTLSYQLAPFLSGNTLRLQSAAISYAALNGWFAISAAHDIVVL